MDVLLIINLILTMPNVADLIYIHQIYESIHLPDGSHFLLASRGAKAN